MVPQPLSPLRFNSGGRVRRGGVLVWCRRHRCCRQRFCVFWGGWAWGASTCDCSAAGVGKTGGGRVGRGGVLVCRRWCRYGRRRLCVYGGGGGQGRRSLVTAPPPALTRPAAVAWSAEGTGHVSAGVLAPTCVGGVAPVAGVCARYFAVAGNAGDPRGVLRIRGKMRGAQK